VVAEVTMMTSIERGVQAEVVRLTGTARRFEKYWAEHAVVIANRAREIGISDHAAAAAMFSLDERRREREELYTPEEVLVGFGSTTIYTYSCANLNIQHKYSGESLKIVRLEVPPDVAENFLLTDIKVGKNSQFYSLGAVPLSAFAADAGKFLKLEVDPWPVGLFLTLSVTNKDRNARNFQGAVVCWRHWGWQGMGKS
jgi:hypothetical protein